MNTENTNVELNEEQLNLGLGIEEAAITTDNESVELNEVAMVERKQAVIAGLAGAIGSGIVGFVGGKYLEKRKRNLILKAIQESVNKMTETIMEEKSEMDLDIEAIKAIISDTIKDKKVSDKEKAEWINVLMLLTSNSAIVAMNDKILATTEEVDKKILDAKEKAE